MLCVGQACVLFVEIFNYRGMPAEAYDYEDFGDFQNKIYYLIDTVLEEFTLTKIRAHGSKYLIVSGVFVKREPW